jgi:hypothetical protein
MGSLASAGGSTGANAANVACLVSGEDGCPSSKTMLGGLGANTWSSSTTLPEAAGAGGSTLACQGGNGGLVIITYESPTSTCSL